MAKFLSQAVANFTQENPQFKSSYFDSDHRTKLNWLGAKIYCQKTAKGWKLIKLNAVQMFFKKILSNIGIQIYRGIEPKNLKQAFKKESPTSLSNRKAQHLYNALFSKFGSKGKDIKKKEQPQSSPELRKRHPKKQLSEKEEEIPFSAPESHPVKKKSKKEASSASEKSSLKELKPASSEKQESPLSSKKSASYQEQESPLPKQPSKEESLPEPQLEKIEEDLFDKEGDFEEQAEKFDKIIKGTLPRNPSFIGSALKRSVSLTEKALKMTPKEGAELVVGLDAEALSAIWQKEKSNLAAQKGVHTPFAALKRVEAMIKNLTPDQLRSSAQDKAFIELMGSFTKHILKNKDDAGYSPQMVNFTVEAFEALALGTKEFFMRQLEAIEKDPAKTDFSDRNPAQDNLTESLADIFTLLPHDNEGFYKIGGTYGEKMEAVAKHLTLGLNPDRLYSILQPKRMTSRLIEKQQKDNIKTVMEASFNYCKKRLTEFNDKMKAYFPKKVVKQPSKPRERPKITSQTFTPLPKVKAFNADWEVKDYAAYLDAPDHNALIVLKELLTNVKWEGAGTPEKRCAFAKGLMTAKFALEEFPKFTPAQSAAFVKMLQPDPQIITKIWRGELGLKRGSISKNDVDFSSAKLRAEILALSPEQIQASLPDESFQECLAAVPRIVDDLTFDTFEAMSQLLVQEYQKKKQPLDNHPFIDMMRREFEKIKDLERLQSILTIFAQNFVPDVSGDFEKTMRIAINRLQDSNVKQDLIKKIKA